MSVDTKKYRDFYYAYSVQSTRADIIEMCDEIDRLKKELAELEQEWDRSDKELAQLREQLRPRSIKDEPPPKNCYILAWQISARRWFCVWTSHLEDCSHWLPMPPAPPQPDAFEEWAKERFEGLSTGYYWAAKEGWDAAIKSTKSHEKTNPMD